MSLNVACAVIVKDDKVFCCKRGPGKSLEGFWEFPGGKIENGEYAYQTVVREIKEELNSEIYPERNICYSDVNGIHMSAELCTLVSGSLGLTEHSDSKWLTVDELDSVEWAPSDKPIVEEIKKWLFQSEYKLCLDKADTKVGDIHGGWDFNYYEEKEKLDVVLCGKMSYVKAWREFIVQIKLQQAAMKNDVNYKWRVVRLYDSSGKQIAQES